MILGLSFAPGFFASPARHLYFSFGPHLSEAVLLGSVVSIQQLDCEVAGLIHHVSPLCLLPLFQDL